MKILKILSLAGPFLIFLLFNHQNVSLHFSFLLGLIAFPYVVRMEVETGGFRFAFLAGLFGLSLLFIRSSSVYYFSATFLMLFALDCFWGRLNYLPALLVVAVSPIINNMVYIWSFPIRLKLSQWAVEVLSWLQSDIQASGNIIILDGQSFSVDPACIGLKMLVTAVVFGILILAYFEKKRNQSLALWQSLALLITVLIAAIFSNFIRLLTLIVFHILPENPLHDVIGLISLGLYVLAPFYLLVRWLYFKKALKKVELSLEGDSSSNSRKSRLIYVALLGLLVVNGFQFLETPVENFQLLESIQVDGFEREITQNGVLKLENETALIYIKPPVRFFQGSHDPRFCWQGSGYTFSEVQLETMKGKALYTAKLQKETDQLYTAWWYENETKQTPHEWDWRWESFKGEGAYYMININCVDRATLEAFIEIEFF